MKYQELGQYVKSHADNHFEKLEWETIKELYAAKQKALLAIPHYNDPIQTQISMAQVYFNYRKAIVYMERVYNRLFKKFQKQLAALLKMSAKVVEGKADEAHVNKVLTLINRFVKKYNDQYKKIRNNVFVDTKSKGNK